MRTSFVLLRIWMLIFALATGGPREPPPATHPLRPPRRPRHRASYVVGHALVRANLADRRRRAKTKRFMADLVQQGVTMDLLCGLRRDIPGGRRLEFLPSTGRLLMEERPDEFAALERAFLSEES